MRTPRRTDHQCKVENVQQYRQVSEKVREYNLVNNLVCNGIHGDEVISMHCKEVSKKEGLHFELK